MPKHLKYHTRYSLNDSGFQNTEINQYLIQLSYVQIIFEKNDYNENE